MIIKDFLKEATKPLVLKRALRVGFIVGIILNIINQWESIFNEFQDFNTLQFVLTFAVPYLVSTYSSVMSRFTFVSGEVAALDAIISCKKCTETSLTIAKGDIVPYCSKCTGKTKWKLKRLLPPDSVIEDNIEKSNALFAEFNPAPVLRVNKDGMIVKANPNARMLYNIEESGENIKNVITELSSLDFKKFIKSNELKTYQIKVNKEYFQIDLKALSDLGVFHIYASKNTSLIKEQNQRRIFQTAIEKTSDSVIVTDIKGNIEYVNEAFEKHSGYKFSEVKGENPNILKSGRQGPEVYKDMWDTIKAGDIWKGLFQNKKKNGELYWEKVTITPVESERGEITHYMSIKEDVTKDIELREKLNSMALFANHNPAPVMRFNDKGIIIEANPAAKNVFDTGNLVNELIYSHIPEIENLDIKNLINQDNETSLNFKQNDCYYHFVIKGVRELSLCHIYGSDITKQKEAEKIIESMALFARLNPEPVFRFNKDFLIVAANPAARSIFPAMTEGADVRAIINAFEDINIDEFIEDKKQIQREEQINGNHYRFMMKGVKESQICQVYTSDITLRVEQEKEIKRQSEKIQSSIRYASDIQNAVLPNMEAIKETLPESFIIYMPRDVVSGDFYWIKEVDNRIAIAIADCTGHGVPGAFMSMLGVAFLNELVTKENLYADMILNKLRTHVITTLSNSEGSLADGMDMALCIIDKSNKTIQYAGANNPFILINDDGIDVIKADRMPIGKYRRDDNPFTRHIIEYKTGDAVYLFSDGYHDQLGGPDLKKFGSKRFKELLVDIHKKSFEEQKQILIDKNQEWVSTYHQIDDILVMGFRM